MRTYCYGKKVVPLLQYIPSTGHSCSSGRVRQSSEAPQLRPDGRVAAHPLLGSRARLAHTQALTLLQLLRVLLERVAEGPEGLALRVELDLDLLGNAGWRPGRTVGATGLQPTAHSGEGGSRARPARAARPPRRAPARRRRCPRRSRAACARRSAPCGGYKTRTGLPRESSMQSEEQGTFGGRDSVRPQWRRWGSGWGRQARGSRRRASRFVRASLGGSG